MSGYLSPCSHSTGENQQWRIGGERKNKWEQQKEMYQTIFNVPLMNSLCWDSHRSILVSFYVFDSLVQKTTNVESKYHEEEQSLEPRTEWSALSFILYLDTSFPSFHFLHHSIFLHPVSTQEIWLESWK